MTTTHSIRSSGAEITYDVHGTLPTPDDRPALLMVGQPMTADGFTALASHLPDRTVVTYDPRGLGRSSRSDGLTAHDPLTRAEDLHAVIDALDSGPVDVFASSGGAVTALALTSGPTRVVVGVAEESGDTLTGRTARALAQQLGQEAVVFPSHQGGFAAENAPYPGRAGDFAIVLREVLDAG